MKQNFPSLDSSLKLFSVINNLAGIIRYSRDYMQCPESVLEHTGWVASWCFFISLQYEEQFNKKLNLEKLLTSAIMHDYDEVGTGDIPKITKYASTEIREALAVIERKSIHWIRKNMLELEREDLEIIWREAKDKSMEGTILKLADIAAVVYQVWNEIIMHNNISFVRVAKELLFIKEFDLGHLSFDNTMFLKNIINSFLEIIAQAINHASGKSHPLPLSYEMPSF